ncbi:sigma 54-interacting transcriptional regulator [Cytobacillus oceanisediminis]|jgi:arginine utilization regulatory protein|uniref:sigma-54 interaction domain-containing protein n=1 Tax=Cytobacillus oceanisediminis TaxID=665099 RepID=UPI0011A21B8A|nr:sigma 54-interacting transcriptional regulator [Mesobacillus sp. MER 33]MCM3232026.1 sigma 54-interacting transcriptional regulator [Mesobacillus sp. MER 48]
MGLNSVSNVTEEILSAILKCIDEAIHVVNTEGITIFYNQVAARHDGLEISEVIGKPLLSVFPSLNDQSSTLLKVIETKKPIYNETQSFVNLHGRKIETVNTTLPIFVQGQLIGAVEIAKDYSRIKQLSERLVEIQKGLRLSNGKAVKQQAGYTFSDVLTTNKHFMLVKKKAEKLAKSDSPILVYGESGTGKELFVQSIHNASKRAAGPFIAQNCAAIPENLLESILFGTSKGSYTGAVDRPGLFELANGGTLFLDELNSMPFDLQAKLLRVLEDGAVRRVGSTNVTSVNVRVISAMNVYPGKAMEENQLRTDLFYRLNVLTFELIPLRQRKEDILYLSDLFISQYNHELRKHVTGLDEKAKSVFLTHQWPGNVRELKHTIEYMMNVCEGEKLTAHDLPMMLKNIAPEPVSSAPSLVLRENLKELEVQLIKDALEASGGNIQQAAILLDIPRQTLQYKIKKLNIQP